MAQTRPHIILIMTDQQRADTIGAWGCDHMVTPQLDRVVQWGVSFRQAYCAGATCIASRAALFTGMYPHSTGVYGFDAWADHRNWVQDLSDAGYWCANIGKMHLNPRDAPGGFHERVVVENPANRTAERGGDDAWGWFLAFHGHERPNMRHRTDPAWDRKLQGDPWHLEERFHADVFIGDTALTWIRHHQRPGPFFLQIGFTGPHEPWDPLPRHLELYRDKSIPPAVYRDGEIDDNPPQHRAHAEYFANDPNQSRIDLSTASDADIERMRRHYYANITTVDEKIGQILDALEARGFLQNTLLIFCSDHGELAGDHRLPYKWLLYDPVVQVPLMIWHTKHQGAPRTIEDFVSLIDVGPTVLEAAGVETPDYFEGQSLLPYLRGEPVTPRRWVFCEDTYLTMIRGRRHKMISYLGQEEGELYDLEEDPHELHNRWDNAAYRQVRDDLSSRLLRWLSTSLYWTAGYRRNRRRHYAMHWPGEYKGTLDSRGKVPAASRFWIHGGDR